MLYSEMKSKEVISVKDCRKLGHICDMEIDHCTGCIKKIIVPGRWHWVSGFCHDQEYVISYSAICEIGPGIVLVNI